MPAAWLAELDEVVLMVYGDPGGPLVGESVAAVVRRIDDARLWRDLPPGRGLRIGLATFEHKDLDTLRATIAGVETAFGQRAGFRGTAIFANDQVWDAPLVPFIEGRVVDASGRAVAGARLRGAGHDIESNCCGGIGFKGLPVEGIELEVTARGYLPTRVPVGRLVPGARARIAACPSRARPMTRLARSSGRGRRLPALLLLVVVLAAWRPAAGQEAADEARALTRAGRLDEALAAYTTLLTAHPEDLEAQKGRARVLGWLHRDAEALEDYDRVLAVTPRDAEAALDRARVLSRLDRLDEAEDAVRAVLASQPSLADAHLALGAVWLRRGQAAAAADAFTRAQALAPEDSAPLVGLARAREAMGDAAGAAAAREAALTAFDRRLAQNPSDRDARVGRAGLLARLGRDAEDWPSTSASSRRPRATSRPSSAG